MKYLYLLKTGYANYKIGATQDVQKHIQSIASSTPNLIKVVASKPIENADEIANLIKESIQNFKADGGNGWFRLTPEQALEVSIQISNQPDIDISEYFSMHAILKEQKWLHKLINKKLDYVINNYQKHPPKKELKVIMSPKVAKPTADDLMISEKELIEEAYELFLREMRASTSMLQRKFRIGYGKASRIIDQLEEKGLIGASNGSKARQVYVKAPNAANEETFLSEII